jgi:hypothetical protein
MYVYIPLLSERSVCLWLLTCAARLAILCVRFLALAGIETVPGAPDENLEIHHNGHTYIGNYYIDSYYVGMEAIYCLLNTKMGDLANENPPIASLTPDRRGVVQICFIPIGKLMTVPLLNHYGTSGNDGSFNTPSPCDW